MYISTKYSIVRNELQLTNWQFRKQLPSLIIINLIMCLTMHLRVIVTTIAFQILFRYANLKLYRPDPCIITNITSNAKNNLIYLNL